MKFGDSIPRGTKHSDGKLRNVTYKSYNDEKGRRMEGEERRGGKKDNATFCFYFGSLSRKHDLSSPVFKTPGRYKSFKV